MTTAVPTDRRPLGYWIETVGRLLAQSLERPLAVAGIDRSAWRTMTVLAREPATDDEVTAAMPPDEAELPRQLPHLVERGWVESVDGRWRLTAAGRGTHDDILLAVSAVRRAATGEIAPRDYATTLATLEQIAANLAATGTTQSAEGSASA